MGRGAVVMIFLCVVFLAWRNAASQETVEVNMGMVHSLAGQVSDPTGASIPGVVVTRTSGDGKKDIETVKTDDNGRYSFDVPDGHYTIRLKASGFHEYIIHATVMHKLHKSLNVTMSVGL